MNWIAALAATLLAAAPAALAAPAAPAAPGAPGASPPAASPDLPPDPPHRCEDCDDWNRPHAPFRLFGSAYFVGTQGLSAVLITGDLLADGERALFCADTLFSIGCGRVIEGDMRMMWESLARLAALPPDTAIYCGHEYTAANVKFALTIEPDNPVLKARAEEVTRLRAENQQQGGDQQADPSGAADCAPRSWLFPPGLCPRYHASSYPSSRPKTSL